VPRLSWESPLRVIKMTSACEMSFSYYEILFLHLHFLVISVDDNPLTKRAETHLEITSTVGAQPCLCKEEKYLVFKLLLTKAMILSVNER
jgi:hypothetical protein